MYLILGPLTFTNNGRTTLYGIVSGPGVVIEPAGFAVCRQGTTFFRVATPGALEWISKFKKQNNKVTK